MTLTYKLPASLSFDTCTIVENELNDLLSKEDYDAVILDASGTKYISSATSVEYYCIIIFFA